MHIFFNNFKFDLTAPTDISISFHSGFGQVNAFYAPPFRFSPVKEGDFVGSTKMGGVVNFMNFQCNPHGNGTHSECVGHISKEDYFVNECIKDLYSIAEVVSIYPNFAENGDKIIERHHLESMCMHLDKVKALVIRTLPNDDEKTSRNYSGTNPVYIAPDAMEWIVEKNIKHLLVDFPSVDREQDEGKLSCHKIFWNYPENPKTDHSITELIYVPDSVKDGIYLLQHNISNIKLDAAPSRPTLFPLININ
jgi:arylformamidase